MQQWSSIRWLVFSLVGLLFFAGVIGIFAGLSYREKEHIVRGHEKLTMENIFNGTFSVERSEVNWVPEGMSPYRLLDWSPMYCVLISGVWLPAGDGVFSLNQNGNISLVDLKTNTTTTLVATADITDVCPNLACVPYLSHNISYYRRAVDGCTGRAGSYPLI
jgi:dipeptidyl aminopeptidase B